MDETIKKMEVVKSEYEYITKKISPLRKFIKIIGKIIGGSKKDTLYKWGYNYKKMIMDKLEDYDQKYPGVLPNLTEIKENLIFNRNEWLIKNLSESKKKLRPKMKIEETLRREKQIKDAIELRIKELDTDKKNFLLKSLERSNNHIGVNHLLVNIDGEKELIMEENEVLKHTSEYYKTITDRKIKSDQVEYMNNINWEYEYIPREDIDSTIYRKLMSKITDE